MMIPQGLVLLLMVLLEGDSQFYSVCVVLLNKLSCSFSCTGALLCFSLTENFNSLIDFIYMEGNIVH